MSDDWILNFLPKLRCPASGQALRLATVEEKQRNGYDTDAMALSNQDGRYFYPIVDGIPHLLPPA
jgi:uncharacterized protein YbaR (Trm112 family)